MRYTERIKGITKNRSTTKKKGIFVILFSRQSSSQKGNKGLYQELDLVFRISPLIHFNLL
ncbi:hypothetical protein DLM78_22980 [Leptospira stimsonii]|uniref:Uncharacterized protein n=1 Tax=Leptospira stimsonii TaxID=2202203 RepID=A0A8B3CHI4_9LEPT|nr:hypothetical protein DLM78_22980 [Leptospira stimsonii]